MIEKLARVMCRGAHELHANADMYRPGEIDAKVDVYWQKWAPIARAALESMRVPTSNMKYAGSPVFDRVLSNHKHDAANAETVWTAMIDQALKDQPA